MDYTLIRSQRKTLSISVTPEGVLVRAPMRLPKARIDEFVLSRRDWIDRQRALLDEREKELSGIRPMTREELRELIQRASEVIPQRVAHYAALAGVEYGRVTVRSQRTRWGSCSAKGDLSFNCLLMLAPPEVLDSVVVHELCHIKELNHSPLFYSHVLRVFPDYYKCASWLKSNAPSLLARLPQK